MNFDRHSVGYSQEVDQALAFVGLQHDFFFEAKVGQILEARAALPPGAVRVLEIGCGVGLLQQKLTPLLKHVWGLDVSIGSLAQAAARDGRKAAADGLRSPFADETFDLVVAVCVLHHVPVEARDVFLAEAARVTRRGGVVALCEHNPWNPLTRSVVRRCAFDRGVVLLTGRSLAQRLRAAGLDGVRARYILFFPWRGRSWRRLERLLAPVPLGGQYFITGTRT